MKALLTKGADPNLKDEVGQTALTMAQQGGHREVVRVLQKAGAGR